MDKIVSKLNGIADNSKKQKYEDIKPLQEKLDSIKNEKRDLIKLYSSGKIDSNNFEEINIEYKENIAELEKQISSKEYNRQIDKTKENALKFKSILIII